MVDYLKGNTIINSPVTDQLLNSLDFRSEINEQTGELTEWPKRYIHGNIRLTIVPAKSEGKHWLEVSGSIHRLHEEGTNWQRFRFSQVQHTVNSVCSLLSILPHQIQIRQIEFGVNLNSPPLSTPTIIDNLVGYKSNAPSIMHTKGGRQIGLEVSGTDSRIKVYNKSMQYCLPVDVCRVEIHAYQHISRTFGISTLADLGVRSEMERVGERLVRRVGNLTFDDKTVDVGSLSPSQIEILAQGRNPRNLSAMSRINRCRFRDIVEQSGTLQISNQLTDAVSQEWRTLLDS